MILLKKCLGSCKGEAVNNSSVCCKSKSSALTSDSKKMFSASLRRLGAFGLSQTVFSARICAAKEAKNHDFGGVWAVNRAPLGREGMLREC